MKKIFTYLFFVLYVLVGQMLLVNAKNTCPAPQIISKKDNCSFHISYFIQDENTCNERDGVFSFSQVEQIFTNQQNILNHFSDCAKSNIKSLNYNKIESNSIDFVQYKDETFDIYFQKFITRLTVKEKDFNNALLWFEPAFYGFIEEEFLDKTIEVRIETANSVYKENIAFEHLVNGSQPYLKIPEEIVETAGEYTLSVTINPEAMQFETTDANNRYEILVNVKEESIVPIPTPSTTPGPTPTSTHTPVPTSSTTPIATTPDPIQTSTPTATTPDPIQTSTPTATTPDPTQITNPITTIPVPTQTSTPITPIPIPTQTAMPITPIPTGPGPGPGPSPTPPPSGPYTPPNTTEDFNSRGTFKLRPGIESQYISMIGDKIQRYLIQTPFFNSCTNVDTRGEDLYIEKNSAPCGTQSSGVAGCATTNPSQASKIHINSNQFTPQKAPFMLQTIWHELTHICDFTLEAREATARLNMALSTGWPSLSSRGGFLENQGYETPYNRGGGYPDYGWTNAFEDVAVALPIVIPVLDTIAPDPPESKPIRCRFIRDIFYGAELTNIGNVNCGDPSRYPAISIENFRNQRINKEGTEFIAAAPYINMLNKNSLITLPRTLTDSYDDLDIPTPPDVYTDSITSQNGIYKVNIEGVDPFIMKISSIGKLNSTARFFYDENKNNQKDTPNEIFYSLKKDILSYKKIEDVQKFSLEEGWQPIKISLNLKGKTNLKTASSLLEYINSQGAHSSQIAYFKDGKWLIYSPIQKHSNSLDFIIETGETYLVKNTNTTSIEFIGLETPSNLEDLKLGWNLLLLDQNTPATSALQLLKTLKQKGIVIEKIESPTDSEVMELKESGEYEGYNFQVVHNKYYHVKVTEKKKIFEI